jgi:3-hydroxyisobutyrate dehydrogenase-like beta-hydroxyacid dehydrogenase
MSKVAVIGTGAMGSRMAIRLLEAGHELHVWNRTQDKMEPLVARGAIPHDSPAEAAREAEAVITMVADPAALRALAEGANGIAGAVDASHTVIEMSTVGPAAINELSAALGDTGLMDAPVLGSLGEAAAGTLMIFMGGERDVVTQWKPLLSVLGEPVHVGPLGSGAAAKLLANLSLITSLSVVGEAVALGDALGLERNVIFDVLAKTPMAAQSERRRESIQKGDFPRRFALALAVKDGRLIAEAADDADLDLPLVTAARRWFEEAEAAGMGDEDYSAVLRYILKH